MKIREKRVERNGHVDYQYLARFGRKWVGLAPYGNRLCSARDALGYADGAAFEGWTD